MDFKIDLQIFEKKYLFKTILIKNINFLFFFKNIDKKTYFFCNKIIIINLKK